ncbi:MAG: ABC transporter ATP-binding protein [Lewinellaceae bacterium]|nr:ABC transporter ATP-binding protein [Saprospiraceae bacterium]MCB9336682.1 ABC transporter ATP-binding protein [Lewinellaceae bacterium]
MQVTFHDVSKRYRYEWIFKGLHYEFIQGGKYAVTGPNGSGKSTLMKVLSGHLTPSKGKLVFENNDRKFAPDEVYQQISYAAPYIDLIEEFTLMEALDFHCRFKPLLKNLLPGDLLELLSFPKAKDKQIRHFSSGMKQRLKLALACCSQSSLILLDEPTTNLDVQGVDWYLGLVEKFLGGRTIVVASNVKEDFGFCDTEINIQAYK